MPAGLRVEDDVVSLVLDLDRQTSESIEDNAPAKEFYKDY